jgi:hypothetical protein
MKVRRINMGTLVAGLWLVLSPFLLGYGQDATASSIILGIAVALVSIIQLNGSNGMRAGWFMTVAGLWLIITPFIFGFNDPAVLWNEFITGFVIVGLGLWGAAGTQLHIRHHQAM